MNAAGKFLHLAAVSIGESVPTEAFSAIVHSVFRSALNLRLKDEDRLLTLAAAGEADLPQGIRVDTPPDFSFERFQTGGPAASDGLFLRLPSLEINLQHALRWSCNLPALQSDLTNPSVLDAWKTVWQALNERQQAARSDFIAQDLIQPPNGDSNRISQIAGDAVRKLLDSARRHDPTDIDAPLRSLIGLGSGLTPSGDDLLVGFFAGLWCSIHKSSIRKSFVGALAQAASRLAARTNDISRAYLLHAARGQVSSRLENLAASICAADSPSRLLAKFESAAQTGHSSGMDTVTGLLLGMNV